MLTKKEIVERISRNLGLSSRVVKQVLGELIRIAGDEIAAEKPFRLYGLGSFYPVKSRRRIGRNPKTGELVKIPRKIRVRFRPGKMLQRGAERASNSLKMIELANLMVSELLLYHSDTIDEGIRNNDLEKRMQVKLQDARENYLSRIPDGLEKSTRYFDEAWGNLIAKRARALDAMN